MVQTLVAASLGSIPDLDDEVLIFITNKEGFLGQRSSTGHFDPSVYPISWGIPLI